MKKTTIIVLFLNILIIIGHCLENPFFERHYSFFRDSLKSLEKNKSEDSLKYIDQAIIEAEKENLSDADILKYNRGVMNIITGNPDNGINDIDQALSSGIFDKTSRSRMIYNKGNAYLSKGDYRKALENYIESYKLNPENEDLLRNMNYAVRMLKNPQSQNKSGENDKNSGQDKNEEQDEEQKDKNNKGSDNQESEDQNKNESDEQNSDKRNGKDESVQEHSVDEVIRLGDEQEKEALKDYIKKELNFKEAYNEKDW